MAATGSLGARAGAVLACWLVVAVVAVRVAPDRVGAQAPFVPGEAAVVRTASGTGANVRAGAGVAADLIGTIPEGDSVQVLDGPWFDAAGAGWYLVGDGVVTGYVDGALLAPVGAPPGMVAVGRVPVLMYHRVDYSGDAYAVTPEQLDAQCRWLVENGYTAITVSQLVDAAYGVGWLPPKPVVLTADDGWASALTFAAILGGYGLVGNYFVHSDAQLGPGEIAALAQWGEVGGHSVNHVQLTGLGYAEQFAEIAENRAYLEAVTGRPVRTLAWPYGASDPSAIQAAVDAGMVAAFDAGGAAADLSAFDPWHIPRIMIAGGDDLATFAAKVTS